MEKYKIVIIESDEGFSSSCPSLRGCHSQGSTKDEAIENIKFAIKEWLAAEQDERLKFHVIEEEVMV